MKFDEVSNPSVAAPASGNKPSKRRTIHGVGVNTIIASMAISGLALFLFILLLKALEFNVSWWWVVAAIPIGMHIGPMLIFALFVASLIVSGLVATLGEKK